MANVTGWTGSDALTGTATADSMVGFGGADTITASSGNDSLYGGNGNDSLIAGDGNDLVFGDRDLEQTWGYRVYDRDFTSASGQAFTIESGTLRGSGLTSGFDVLGLTNSARGTTGDANDFGVIFTSTFTATTAGVYRFTSNSDDGSTVRLFDGSGVALNFANQTGGTLAYMNNDFHQSAASRFGDVTLAAGQSYTIEVRYWENLGQNVLGVTVTPPGGAAVSLANSSFIGNPAAGNTGNDVISGGAGLDTLYGEAGNDTLSGDADNDLLYGGAGRDSLLGGLGADRLFGEASDDTLLGESGADSLDGGDGADALFGGSENDTLLGQGGADSLDGGDGADVLFGGDGNDTIMFGSGNDSVFGGTGDDLIDDIGGSNLVGANLIDGGDGNDTAWAGFGDDTLYGGVGADVLSGEDNADLLFGGVGSDTLYGGAGNDTFWGDDGADLMVGGDDRDLFYGGLGDTIDGSNSGADNDVLDLTAWGKDRTNIIRDPMNRENGIVQFLDSFGSVIGTLSFTEIETTVPCFTPGSLVATAHGDIAVEDLRAGDLVMTRDHGLQPLRWAGRRDLTMMDLFLYEALRPVLIRKGAFGDNLPVRDMMVSPQHRMLLTDGRAEMYFGDAEVLVTAGHLIGQPGIARVFPKGVSYLHLLFDRHEILCVDGVWTESLQPADRMMQAMDDARRAEILHIFPDLAENIHGFAAARRSLKAYEARVLLAA